MNTVIIEQLAEEVKFLSQMVQEDKRPGYHRLAMEIIRSYGVRITNEASEGLGELKAKKFIYNRVSL